MKITLGFDVYGTLVDPSGMAKHLADDLGSEAASFALTPLSTRITSLASAGAFFGVWNAQEWARWTLGTLSALGALVIHVPYVIGATHFETAYLKISLALGVGAVFALNPSMKRHFATVRDVLAGRDVRGRRPRRSIERPASDRIPRHRAAHDEDAPPNAGAK